VIFVFKSFHMLRIKRMVGSLAPGRACSIRGRELGRRNACPLLAVRYRGLWAASTIGGMIVTSFSAS
jgi:hypothetical protein